MKIAVLLSGGVDSSVVLRQLVSEKKYDITAFYLKIWLEDEFQYLGQCPWEEDLGFARKVTEGVNVPLEIISLQKEYWERVVTHTISELKQGRTPSPDILCNQRVKFGAFNDVIGHNFEKIASGHYAQVAEQQGVFWLKKGIDPIKDQTYFLSHLSQKQLSRCLFPIGAWMKQDVRKLARQYDLVNQERKDSQGICFLGKIKYSEFVKGHLGEQLGEIRELEWAQLLGEHKGYWFHTIGQRRGLGLHGGPWYVVGKDIKKNIIYVSSKQDLLNRSCFDFKVAALNWITTPPPTKQPSC